MKKVLFLFLILSSVFAFSCKTEDEEYNKNFLTLLCSGVEFPEKDVFVKLKNSWVEPQNYTFTYEYQKTIPFVESETVECVIENGKLKSAKFNIPEYNAENWTQEEYDSFKQEMEQKSRKMDFDSIKSIFDFCQKEYESAQNNRYVYKTRISMTLDDSGSYPVFFESYVNDIYAYTHVDHPNELIGFSTSGFSTIVKILDFKIN